MTRRLLLLATLMTLGLTGCVTYSDSYYRQSQYRDGGYYYPAQDGYGDYYQGREQVQYVDYYYSSYTPFWGLSRYYCAGYYSCSPFWNGYYGRPYTGWNLAFGSHYNYGRWGWYGSSWAPWAGPGYYGHRPHRPEPRHRPPGTPSGPGDAYVFDSSAGEPGNPGLNAGGRGPWPREDVGQGYSPGYSRAPGSGGVVRPGQAGGVEMAPVPRAGFRPGGKPPAPLPPGVDEEQPLPRSNFGKGPGGPLPEPAPGPGMVDPREEYREATPQPGYEEVERYEPREVERFVPREVERYEPREVERFEPREVERYEPREVERYEPAPRMERPEPMSRPEPMEMSGPSQFESRSDEE